MTKIRKVHKKDLNELWQMEKATTILHKSMTPKKYLKLIETKTDNNAKKKYHAEIKKEMKNGKGIFLIAEYNNSIIGYISGSIYDWEFGDDKDIKLASIWDVYVKKEFRRMGIATQLVKEFEKTAKMKKCFGVILRVWKNNLPAIQFYKNKKFEQFYETFIKRIK